MSKADFTREEFAQRRARVRQAMQEQGLDWLLAFHPVSIHWLTGSDAKSYQAFQCMLVSARDDAVTVITREGERNEYTDDTLADEVIGWGGGEPQDPLDVFRTAAQARKLLAARVGMEVPAYYLHPHHYVQLKEWLGTALVAEATNLINDLKMVKSPAELAYIRQAGRMADQAMARFVRELQVGRTELQAAGAVYHELLGAGSGIAGSTLNLVSGERSSFSHGAPTQRRFQRGDFGNIEYGAACKRYTVTIGRQFCFGEPTPRMRELYGVVRAAADACIAAIRAGVPAVVPHEAAKKVIADAGFDRYRIHTSGYGIAPGFPPAWGEPVNMFGGNPYTLQAGMVVSVEPPVFIGEEKLGARIIDNVLVTHDGAELISAHDRDLIVVS
jgi:Xaa-Pro dipeptidase